jgi:PAS domain S-box-containing protein
VSAIPLLVERPPRVLIVDDEHRNRQLLEVMLAPGGYRFLTAASGSEAMAIVEQQRPDVILLDVMMPESDGYGVAAKIKGNLATKNIPIIMITALDNRSARIQALSVGAEDFLTKPVDRAELCMRVRNLSRLKAYADYHENQAAVLREQAALLDLAHDAIVALDLHGRILYWNRGAEAMYGWVRSEALGMNAAELVRAEPSESAERIEAALLRDGRWVGEAVHVARDESRLTVACSHALQRDSCGTPIRVLTISSDITARKQVDRMKGEFIATVSHELRTPLTSIRGALGIIRAGAVGSLPEEAVRLVEIAYQNSGRLAHIVDDILNIEAIDGGKMSVVLSSQWLAALLEQAVEENLGVALRYHVALVLTRPLPEVRANVDASRMIQVLANLLSNAVKFSPADASVVVGMIVVGPSVKISVTDRGPGIPCEFRSRIFQRFSQADGSDSRRKGGTGLGLSIAKALIERMGGTINYESEPAVATTFTVDLPVALEE